MARRFGAIALVLGAALATPVAAQAAGPACLGDTTAADVTPVKGAPPLGFGINPAGFAGALGPPVAETPEDPAKTLAALSRLRPPHAPFTLRLNRLFWSDHGAGITRFARLARHYIRHGYRVEVQVRYHPDAKQEGRIGAWVDYVKRVTRRLGSIRGVTGLQITNEVNFLPIAPDASDSSFAGARDALIRGVEAAHRVVRSRHLRQVTIGFNWAYTNTPANETGFWSYLQDHGGERFVRGPRLGRARRLPGHLLPADRADPDGLCGRNGQRDERAARLLHADGRARRRHPDPRRGERLANGPRPNGGQAGRRAAADGEGGQPTSAATTASRSTAGSTSATTNTSSTNFQHHYGLLRDDYTKKPAFGVYRRLVAKLAG